VVASGDRAGRALGLADRPVLLEGGGTSDGGLVGTGVGADSVDTTITGDGAELSDTRLASAAGVVRAVRFDNVVLSLGAVDPAVDGEVGATSGLVVGGVGDGASSTSRPTETDDEIAVDAVVPVHGVGASVGVGGELTKVTVVVLDVVDATRAGTLDLSCLISKMVLDSVIHRENLTSMGLLASASASATGAATAATARAAMVAKNFMLKRVGKID
jgi:hypothetical protein